MRARNQGSVATFTIFLDRSLGKHTIANALRQTGIDVQIHDDHFDQDATDEHWLCEVGRLGREDLDCQTRHHRSGNIPSIYLS